MISNVISAGAGSRLKLSAGLPPQPVSASPAACEVRACALLCTSGGTARPANGPADEPVQEGAPSRPAGAAMEMALLGHVLPRSASPGQCREARAGEAVVAGLPGRRRPRGARDGAGAGGPPAAGPAAAPNTH